MIAKTKQGSGFGGVLRYALGKDCERIASNMAGETPKQLAQEFGEIRKLRPSLGKAVSHVSLSAAQGERLSAEQWSAVGHQYMQGMGYTDNQFIMVRHQDTEHDHVHLIINRITSTGDVVSDSQNYKRQDPLMRQIEQDFGLQRVVPSSKAERRAASKGEIEHTLRTGSPSARQQLQQLASAAVKDCTSYSDYDRNLTAVGVELIPYTQLNGAKLNGLMYRLDGIGMKGSDLGRAYTPAGLAKQGIGYEQDRDATAIRRATEREAHRANQQADSAREDTGNPESRRLSQPDRTLSPSYGEFERGERGRDQDPHPANRPDQDRAIDHPSRHHPEQPSYQEREPQHHPENLGIRSPDRHHRSDQYERIIALARPTRAEIHTGRGELRELPDPSDQTSYRAAQRQISALHSSFDGVYLYTKPDPHKKAGQGYSAAVKASDLGQHWQTLQRQQALGASVRLLPTNPNLIVITDLSPKAIADMTKEGLTPLIVTKQQDQHTAIIRIGDERQQISKAHKQAIGERSAARHGGTYSVGGIALAGFSGVELVSSTDQTAELGKRQVIQLEERDEQQRIEQDITRQIDQRMHAILNFKESDYRIKGAARVYLMEAQKQHRKDHSPERSSEIDSEIAKTLLKTGRFEAKEVTNVIQSLTPNVRALKSTPKYAQNRVEGALSDKMVQISMQEQKAARIEKERDNDRGYDGGMMR